MAGVAGVVIALRLRLRQPAVYSEVAVSQLRYPHERGDVVDIDGRLELAG